MFGGCHLADQMSHRVSEDVSFVSACHKFCLIFAQTARHLLPICTDDNIQWQISQDEGLGTAIRSALSGAVY